MRVSGGTDAEAGRYDFRCRDEKNVIFCDLNRHSWRHFDPLPSLKPFNFPKAAGRKIYLLHCVVFSCRWRCEVQILHCCNDIPFSWYLHFNGTCFSDIEKNISVTFRFFKFSTSVARKKLHNFQTLVSGIESVDIQLWQTAHNYH